MNNSSTVEEIDRLLHEYHQLKLSKNQIQQQYDNHKSKIIKLMNNMNIDVLVSRKYKLASSLKVIKKETLPKVNIPVDLWNKYKNNTSYRVLYLKKIHS